MLMLNCLHCNVQIIGHCWVPLIRDVYEEWCVYSMGYTWANTQRNKHVIIRSKHRYGIIITCSSCCVSAGWLGLNGIGTRSNELARHRIHHTWFSNTWAHRITSIYTNACNLRALEFAMNWWFVMVISAICVVKNSLKSLHMNVNPSQTPRRRLCSV